MKKDQDQAMWKVPATRWVRIQNGALAVKMAAGYKMASKLSRWPPCRPAKVRDINFHHIIKYQTMVEHSNIIAN